MIVKLSSIPHAVACLTNGKLLEDVSGALQAMLKVKLKETAVKQEIEKRAELVRSCLRALLALAKATGAMTVSDANDEIVLRPAANAKLVAVLRETLVTVGLGEQMKELAVDMKSA